METSAFKSPATRKLRLQPLPPSQLPAHPLLAPLQPASHALAAMPFAHEILAEAVAFTDTVVPETFQKKGSPKSSDPSHAKVQLLSSDLIKGEAWYARQSEHEDRAERGTATSAEFVAGLFDEHSVHEMEYTPDVFDAYKVLDWQEQMRAEGRFEAEGLDGGHSFSEIYMEIYEMCHHIPSPLENRVFPTLVVRAKTGADSFVVAQIPVDISKLPEAMYSNGRHRAEGSTAQKKEKVVLGQYTSIERVKPSHEHGKINWEMATASDAKGSLPQFLQNLGVPGAIVKDVGFFMKWTAERRRGAA